MLKSFSYRVWGRWRDLWDQWAVEWREVVIREAGVDPETKEDMGMVLKEEDIKDGVRRAVSGVLVDMEEDRADLAGTTAMVCSCSSQSRLARFFAEYV